MSSAGNSGNAAEDALRAALGDMFDLAMNDPDAVRRMTQDEFYQRYPNVPLEIWGLAAMGLNSRPPGPWNTPPAGSNASSTGSNAPPTGSNAPPTGLNGQPNLDFYRREMEMAAQDTHDSDDQDNHNSDDSDDSLADEDIYDSDDSDDSEEFGGGRYHPEAPVTEGKVEPPRNFSPKCTCAASGRGNSGPCINCACSKWGYRCSPLTCGCSTACQNPFNALPLEDLFGSATVELHPCFVTWVLKRGYKKAGRSRVNQPQQITLKWLFDRVQENDDIEDYSDAYNVWVEQWETVDDAADDNPRKIHLMQSLLRLAFEEDYEYADESHGYYFSFCRKTWGDNAIGRWVQEDNNQHCRGCGTCGDWRDWHCIKCNECTDGVTLRCSGCKGVSEMYHEQHMIERDGFLSDSDDSDELLDADDLMNVDSSDGFSNAGSVDEHSDADSLD
ncbi:hypothetical protein IWZ01DRAFT_3590 [Phyllosticta capitalensis]